MDDFDIREGTARWSDTVPNSTAQLRVDGIEPVIKYREFTDHDRALNDRLKDAGYGQRWMAEKAFSAIKRTISTSVGARSLYLQFREMVLIAAVYNIRRRLRR